MIQLDIRSRSQTKKSDSDSTLPKNVRIWLHNPGHYYINVSRQDERWTKNHWHSRHEMYPLCYQDGTTTLKNSIWITTAQTSNIPDTLKTEYDKRRTQNAKTTVINFWGNWPMSHNNSWKVRKKGHLPWLSALPIKAVGYALNKQEFTDACLREIWMEG